MGKFKKGHKVGFKVGLVPHNKMRKGVSSKQSDSEQTHYVRLTREMTNLVKNVPYKEDKSLSNTGIKPATLLRSKSSDTKKAKPVKSAKEKQRIESKTNRTINIKLNAVMWNAVFHEHSELSPHCKGFLEWDMSKEERWGLGNSECAICDTCSYQSKKYKLYEEVKTGKKGRKPAKMNIGAQAALAQTPISTTSFRKILLGTNSVAPSAKGLQKRANAVLPKIKEINESDMKRLRKRLINIKKLRGAENPSAVSLQGDGAYNNPLYSGVGRTPFQPATQMVYTVAENETQDKSILTVVAKNKLCSIHPVNPNSGKFEQCTENCSSTLTFLKSIGDEYSWAKEALTDLNADEIEAKHFTTDPDSSAFKAAEDLYHENITQTEPEHFLDTRHLADNHRKNIKKNPQILNMMPGRTKKEKENLQNNFSLDLSARCTSEFTEAMEKYGGNFQKMKNKISFICDAIPMCYTGNHELCRRHSFVCKGGKKFWLKSSSFLTSMFKILNTTDNISEIRKCILYRLGPDALNKTKLNLNTQKVEGFNRSLRRSLPKNVTFTKNFEGRVHAAVHSVNLGPGESLMLICDQLGAPVTAGSSVEKSLKLVQRTDKLQKEHKKSLKYKKSMSDKKKVSL
ncbi:unnamed protein product [Mytilus edulis]|uniref:Mutator-like transposase domain-containing protein n=1 Tax=Mytilus edulis TaxID=6550 RepID=A0A8S3RLU8_MYTED|nr:unnamed protein product [Mytilus edulis]